MSAEGEFMFRVEVQHGTDALVMQMEGQLSGDYAEYTRTLVTRCNAGMRLVVDLTDVTFADSVGEDVLSLFGRVGAEFIADNAYSRDLCERLQLPLARTALPRRRDASQ
jgi:hypothetical protein